MKLDLFQVLQQARANKQRAAMVTDLGSGEQALVAGTQILGALDLGAEALAALEDAFAKDRSGAVEIGNTRLFLHIYNPPLPWRYGWRPHPRRNRPLPAGWRSPRQFQRHTGLSHRRPKGAALFGSFPLAA